MKVVHLTVMTLANPLGIDAARPTLGWLLEEAAPNTSQAAYRVQVSATGGFDDVVPPGAPDRPRGSGGPLRPAPARVSPLAWDSGRVDSAAQSGVRYEGAALASGLRYAWRVMAWDQDGVPTPWSEDGWWEMGLLRPSDWHASWIEPGWDDDARASRPAPYLRSEFEIPADSAVRSARAYATAHGCYELSINGQPVGDMVFAPGWTAYRKRLQYQAYDVTGLLRPGRNALGAILGDGWWRGKVGAESLRNVYGTQLALLAQLVIDLEDGRRLVMGTGPGWRATTGPILSSDFKDGEVYDARLEMPGWDSPGFDDGAWTGVRVADHPLDTLVAQVGHPVRRRERFTPVAVLRTPAGQVVLDMGQNFAGRLRMRATAPVGTTVTLRHGETLDRAGNFTLANLMLPIPGSEKLLQRDRYTFRGNPAGETFEPRFTFHGFRYVLVEGLPGPLDHATFEGVALYSDMPQTGTFECSNDLLNRLQANITWSQKSNFVDIPTDCPQRERAGWTGDAQVYAPTAAFNMDTAVFFRKWLADLAAEQRPNGLVPNLVPDPYGAAGRRSLFLTGTAGSVGWGDAAILVPVTLFERYGDAEVLEAQYESMRAWVEYMAARARRTPLRLRLSPRFWASAGRRRREPHIWDTNYHWGEWLEPGSGVGVMASFGVARRFLVGAPPVATAYLAHSAALLAGVAARLGRAEDAARYGELRDRVREAFVAQFVRPDGRMVPDRQASYVRALAFDLLPASLRPPAARRLVELIRAAGTHLGTGFLSTVFLLPVLADAGYLDVAYEVLLRDTVPSWLYEVRRGATTIWETWDAVAPDGRLRTASHNHYAPGAVGQFLYEHVAGIAPAEPGYARVRIRPRPGGGLTWASATYRSVRGEIASRWRIENATFELDVRIPPNATALVTLPDGSSREAGSGDHRFAIPWPGSPGPDR